MTTKAKVCRCCRYWEGIVSPYGHCKRIGHEREEKRVAAAPGAYIQDGDGGELITTIQFSCNLFTSDYGVLPPGAFRRTYMKLDQCKDGERLMANSYAPPARSTCWHAVRWEPRGLTLNSRPGWVTLCGNPIHWLRYGVGELGTICGLCAKRMDRERKQQEFEEDMTRWKEDR